MSKKVLLVCYEFPPNTGIGGRKWAFLAKYLVREDIELHVLTKENKNLEDFAWGLDLHEVKKHFFKANYPTILDHYPIGVLSKIKYRIVLLWLKIFIKGNFYDRGKLLRNKIIKKTNDICRKHGIENVIFSGGPFSFLYYGSLIKRVDPRIKLIADSRDPWTFGNYHGFDNLSKYRQKIELVYLKKVLSGADFVTVPNEKIKDYYYSIDSKVNIEIHPHAIDEIYVKKRNLINRERLLLVNFGSQYFELEALMRTINDEITHTKIDIEFYTSDLKYKQVFENNQSVVFLNPVNYNVVFEVLSRAGAALLFVNRHIKDFLSTKYIESIAARIPIVLIGEKGFVSDFIEYNKLGIFIDAKNLESEFIDIPERLRTLEYNTAFDISPYTFEKQAKEIIELLD